MKENTFSICLPTCGRPNLTIRAIQSIEDQIYPHWELIVVDDGSSQEIKDKLEEYIKATKNKKIKLLHHPQRIQRCATRNTGMRAAKNEWLCHLDSDDEYLRTYLNSANHFINEYPDYKCFHGGALVCKLGRYHVRETPNLAEEEEHGEAMQRFKSGTIGMGSFFYKREIHDDIGLLPEAGSPYKFGDLAKDIFPEFVEWHGPKYLEGGKEIGNPWGEDYFLFYAITRKYKSKGVPMICYMNYIRRSGFIEQDDDMLLLRKKIFIA